MKVAKWGNSLAIRLPSAVVEQLGLKLGDDIEIAAAGKRPRTAKAGRRSFAVKKAATRRDILAQLRKYRGMIPADFKFDRDEANERG